MSKSVEELLPLLARLAEDDGELVSLADLAARDGRSPFHLQRIFRAAIGESPAQYSRRIRLQRAAASLLVTNKTVLEVALDAGFESHDGFTRAFRRRFDITPQAFREQRRLFDQLVRQHRTHLEIAHRFAPCVGLHRVSTQEKASKTNLGGPEMSYTIQKQDKTETPFLFIRRQAKPEGIAEALGSMLPAVFQYATAKGIAFAGPPTVRYPSFGPGLVTLEAGLPVTAPAEGEGEIELGALVGGPAATTVHKGPYDGLGAAHEAVQAWLAENGQAPNGAPWETYLNDPGEVPNPAEWLTEITWPIRVG
ncbi:MAG: helix-turn-helix domain-containing protein [Acidobacteriota bacterium]